MNIEKWVILSSSLPPDWTISPLSDALRLPYANETKSPQYRVYKKRMYTQDLTGFPSQVLFYCPFSCCPLPLSVLCAHQKTDPVFSVRTTPTVSQRILRHFPPDHNDSTAPLSLATAAGSGDSVKTGQREPMGLWVALSASVRDTVHMYRL